jgi:hypothetical protein
MILYGAKSYALFFLEYETIELSLEAFILFGPLLEKTDLVTVESIL